MNNIKWRNTGGDWEYSVSSVVEVIKDLAREAGIELLDEPALANTGGGCAAIEVKTKDDRWIVVTDGDVLSYSDGEWQRFYEGWTVGVYGVDPEGGGWTEETLSFHTEEGSQDTALAQAFAIATQGDELSRLVRRLEDFAKVINENSDFKHLERAGLADDITEALTLIRTHALPPGHPLAVD